MYLTGYSMICDPWTGKLPLYECIESWYPYLDEFVFFDCSKYDEVDLSKYKKVRRHVKGVLPVFDAPFGAGFSTALRLVQSDHAAFIDCDEILTCKTDLREVIKRYPLEQGAGIALSLRNYYCDRYHLSDGCSSKGSHIFRMRDDLFHDMIRGHTVQQSSIRRTHFHPDISDAVRLVDSEGNPMAHYQPVSPDEVIIEHTSHLDLISKMVRSILQFQHTSTIDLPGFFPFDARFEKKAIDMIYSCGLKDIEDKSLELYKKPIPFDYDSEPCQLLEDFIKRADIREFNPEDGYPLMDDPFTGNFKG